MANTRDGKSRKRKLVFNDGGPELEVALSEEIIEGVRRGDGSAWKRVEDAAGKQRKREEAATRAFWAKQTDDRIRAVVSVTAKLFDEKTAVEVERLLKKRTQATRTQPR